MFQLTRTQRKEVQLAFIKRLDVLVSDDCIRCDKRSQSIKAIFDVADSMSIPLKKEIWQPWIIDGPVPYASTKIPFVSADESDTDHLGDFFAVLRGDERARKRWYTGVTEKVRRRVERLLY